MIGIKDITGFLIKMTPRLKRELRIAHIKISPHDFVRKSFISALYISLMITALLFFLFAKLGVNLLLLLLIFPSLLFFFYFFMIQSIKGTIRKREREINMEVLFAGRYLLVKMESGTPLFNSLIDASRSYGVSAKYFQEIVDDINTGIPIEEALETAREYNSSEKFKRVIWQIVSAIKSGTDVTESLRGVLKSIAAEQVIEIKAYGKKLNSLMMFYLIIAGVVPSLGITLLIIISGFLQLNIGTPHLIAILFFLAIVQMMFIAIIRSVRPMVNL